MNKSIPTAYKIILLMISSAMILSLFGCFPTKSEKELILNYNRCRVTLNMHGHFIQTVHASNSTSNVDWDESWGGDYSIAIGSFDGNKFTGSWDETDEDGERTWGTVTVVLSEIGNGNGRYDKVSSIEWIENFTWNNDGAWGSSISTFTGSNLPKRPTENNYSLEFWNIQDGVCSNINSITHESKGKYLDFSLQKHTCNINSEFEIIFDTNY